MCFIIVTKKKFQNAMLVCINLKMMFLTNIQTRFLQKITFNKDVLFYIQSTPTESLLSPCAEHRCFKIVLFLDQADWLAFFTCEFLNILSPDQ